MFVYHLEEIFDTLQKRADVPIADIARREYAYLPLSAKRLASIWKFLGTHPGQHFPREEAARITTARKS